MLATDSVTLGDRRRTTKDGYLVVDARVARVGVQTYLGTEVGRPELGTVRVYRSPEEVFSDEARASFAHKPVTVDHPSEAVNADNWSRYAKGYTGGDIAKDGDYLRVPFALMDASAIAAVDAGRRELSNGYTCDLDWTPGVTPTGEAYDASQRNIRGNHLAIVHAGRAGSQCRIGDSWPASDDGASRTPGDPEDTRNRSIKETGMKTHLIGDNAVEMSDAAIVAVKALQTDHAKLQTDHGALVADHAKLQTDHSTTLQAKDAEIAAAKTAAETKDGEIAALKQQLKDAELSPAKLDAAVTARAQVIADAKKVGGDKIVVDGKTEAEIRREAVTLRLGDAAKTLSDDAINGAFLSYAADAKANDPIRRALIEDGKTPQVTTDAATAYAQMRARDRDAWKPKEA